MPKSAATHATHPSHLTLLLQRYSAGDDAALAELLAIVEPELNRLAAGYLRRERSSHTLQPTALVNEAYLVLVQQREKGWENRSHFMAVAALAMRQVLVQHARRHKAQKRGGDQIRVTLQEVAGEPGRDWDLDALDEALQELAKESPRQSRVIELRFFGGLTLEEVAGVLQISERTVKREWTAGRAWLYARLSERNDAE